jgi:hypothetical protein
MNFNLNEKIIKILQEECDNFGVTDMGISDRFIECIMFELHRTIPELYCYSLDAE